MPKHHSEDFKLSAVNQKIFDKDKVYGNVTDDIHETEKCEYGTP